MWAEAPQARWDDWTWQQQNRVTRLEDLERVVSLTAQEREAFEASKERFRVSITPYYASLMDPDDPRCPVRQQRQLCVNAGHVLHGAARRRGQG